jgi:catechol 2,3-dioxygenase-like lactoylglutathione lyase family enzyme
MPVRDILETSLCVRDLAEAEAFYRDVLGLTVYSSEPPRHVFFRMQRGMFLLFNPEATRHDHVVINGAALPHHGTTGAGHVAFRMAEAELESWRAKLTSAGVAIESEVRWPNGGRSIYFRDPSGNSVELATPKLWEFTAEDVS